jgi:RNA polymerase sigma factor (sigma-70 family)
VNTASLGEHFFRREYGRLVSALSRRMGVHNLELIEDAAQSALMAALASWTTGGLPDHPEAWLFRVAHNHVLGELRGRARRERLLDQHEATPTATDPPILFLTSDLRDDLLRMLFLCCDEAIPIESQLVIALKTLCGFDVREIAERLFTSEANVYKRLGRARSRLRQTSCLSDDLTDKAFTSRISAVHTILYLLFTEGYLSSQAEAAIRRELCEEAIRLTEILAEHPIGAAPETFALLALMHLHTARLAARQDGAGGLLLLEEQDRGLWDQRQIVTGLAWLARSASGEVFSRYHAEAGVAAEHCLARSLADTRWDRIVECYALLERLAPSALHMLNRAIAVAEWRGPSAGLAVLEGHVPPSWLTGSYLWAAVLAYLHERAGHEELARNFRDSAIDSAPSAAIKELLGRRLKPKRRTSAPE